MQYNDRQIWIQRYGLGMEIISDRELLSLIFSELLDLTKLLSNSHCISHFCGPVVILDQLLSNGDNLENLAKVTGPESAAL
jgi:hypothetical protein